MKLEEAETNLLYSVIDEIMKLIEEKRNKMDELFDKSDLPNEVDLNLAHEIILKIRCYKN